MPSAGLNRFQSSEDFIVAKHGKRQQENNRYGQSNVLPHLDLFSQRKVDKLGCSCSHLTTQVKIFRVSLDCSSLSIRQVPHEDPLIGRVNRSFTQTGHNRLHKLF